ncbi:MAG TPA: hypothetical protein VH641_14455 [Streptosporangiaceae bacterium]|jgi:hypothetical protein
MSPLEHLDAAEGHFARCQSAEQLAETVHGPHPSVRHYPLGQLARAVWHVAAANVALALARKGGAG